MMDIYTLVISCSGMGINPYMLPVLCEVYLTFALQVLTLVMQCPEFMREIVNSIVATYASAPVRRRAISSHIGFPCLV